jgi:hypothetical protein
MLYWGKKIEPIVVKGKGSAKEALCCFYGVILIK